MSDGLRPGEGPTLPSTPGPALAAIWGRLEPSERAALAPHLLGGTPAEWVCLTLRQSGHVISPSSIRAYRRRLRNERAD